MATFPVILLTTTRLPSSINGNPRFNLHTSEGSYVTASDAAINYDVDNLSRRLPLKVELHTTRAFRVFDIKEV